MKSRHTDLTRIGWNEWFEEREKGGPADTIARVAAVDRDLLLLMDQTGTFRAKLAGSYLYRHHLSQELPCVGDWVWVKKHPTDELGLVHMLLERRTALRRKAAGDSIDYQMIAANVDYVIIVQSCHYDFNLKRLERYLVMVRDGGADPYVLLTKTDLVEPVVLASQLAEIRAAGVTAPVLTLSNVRREGIDDLKRTLRSSKTYCFVGSSGVGKSTIINQLIGRERLQTKGVSGTGEGRHTTVRRELIILEGGALVIDNPGMREFGILGAESGIGGSFSDIIGSASGCRYRNCSHTGEPGCAVLEAVNSGALSQEHYDNYLKLREESEFHQMSYVEKRKKDRDFGRYIKSAKKDLKNK
ncbi:MAG: ribosome small subunit-dependent GTPase A [Deltaproteobacteria bacterium]|nr:ribosome small subunit-dependent GTPase A [Deltaproteobacteria bacterium]